MPRFPLICLATLSLLISACSTPKQDEKPMTGTLARTLDMVDKDGRHYGTVELDPVGGGKVFDSDGRMVGTIVPPSAK